MLNINLSDNWEDLSDFDDSHIYDYSRGTCPHYRMYYKNPKYVHCQKCWEAKKRTERKGKIPKTKFKPNFKQDNFTCPEVNNGRLFRVLEMRPCKDISKIKKQYYKLSKKYHPDKGGDCEKFRAINSAYIELTEIYGTEGNYVNENY